MNTLQDVADEKHPITPAPENQEEFSEKFVVECEQLVEGRLMAQAAVVLRSFRARQAPFQCAEFR